MTPSFSLNLAKRTWMPWTVQETQDGRTSQVLQATGQQHQGRHTAGAAMVQALGTGTTLFVIISSHLPVRKWSVRG